MGFNVFQTLGIERPVKSLVRTVGKVLPMAASFATGGLGGAALGGTLGKVLPWLIGGKQVYDAYSADRNADRQAAYYDSLLRGGPTAYQFTPEEKATYKGASDMDIARTADRRRSSILSTLGRRGMLDSSVAPSMLTGLNNWQDQQRTTADVTMQNDAYNRGANTWQTQLQGAQFGVNNAQQNAAAGGSSLAQTLQNLGTAAAYRAPAPVNNDSWTPDTSAWDNIQLGGNYETYTPATEPAVTAPQLNVFGRRTGLQRIRQLTPTLYGGG